MPGYRKRKYTMKGRTGRRYKKQSHYAASALQAAARRAILQVAETKKGTNSISDGQEIFHNNYISLADNLVATTQGTQNPDDNTGLNRIGDQIQLKGVKLNFMVELNERYSDVTFRLLIVKCARGDTPSRATLFNGASTNKMLDTLNTDRYTIISQKWFKLKAPNTGTWGGEEVVGSGAYEQADAHNYAHNRTLSRATKIIKHWIPGSKFTKSSILQYEDGGPHPKFFEYRAFLYAYSNYTTLQDVYYVARLNDVVKVMYYKDI